MNNKTKDGNEAKYEAFNARLIANRDDSQLMNRQMQTNVEQRCTSSSSRHTVPTTRGNGPFINGDLIDLCDSTNEHSSESSRDLVEAINTQLLHEINGTSQTNRNCCTLYPTKVSLDNTISGTKLNHTKKLNNSVNLSTAGRSSEAIGRCNESNGCNTTNEQHQTVLREFKRLGTYCTLRPEQRRKHLLKVLPTLRNSVLLRTLLASNPSVSKNLTKISAADETLSANKNIDSLLIDLDDFIIDGNTALMQRKHNEQFTSNCDCRSQRSDGTSVTSHCYNASNVDEICGIEIDPDKIEDCLLELDAYLEEIDRDYVLACAANGPSTSTSVSPHNSNGSINVKLTKISANVANEYSEKTSKNHIDRLLNMSHSNGSNGGSSSSSAQVNQSIDSCINDKQTVISASNLRKMISSSDIQMNLCGKLTDASLMNGSRNVDNKRTFIDTVGDQPLKRGHKLRNTVSTSGQNNRTIRSVAAPSRSGKFN